MTVILWGKAGDSNHEMQESGGLLLAAGLDGGERSKRCRWQSQRGERVAAVGKIEEKRKPEDFSGNHNRTHGTNTFLQRRIFVAASMIRPHPPRCGFSLFLDCAETRKINTIYWWHIVRSRMDGNDTIIFANGKNANESPAGHQIIF